MIVAINDDQVTILWSEEPKRDVGNFASMVMPLVRRVFPPQLGPQLVSIQPMSLPAGAVFYLDYTYGGWRSDPRCNSGPWHVRMFWKAWLCTSTRIQSWWQSSWSWVRSWSLKGPTNVTNQLPSKTPEADRQREVLTTLVQDPDRARKLVEKWQGVLTRSGPRAGPSEET